MELAFPLAPEWQLESDLVGSFAWGEFFNAVGNGGAIGAGIGGTIGLGVGCITGPGVVATTTGGALAGGVVGGIVGGLAYIYDW